MDEGTRQKGSKLQANMKQPPNSDIAPSGTVHMKRQITLLGGISMTAGSMIGAGIFVLPGNIMQLTDSAFGSLSVWTFCGFMNLLMAFSYMELGTLVTRSGGEHAYYQAAFKHLHPFFGELPAFMFAWTLVILYRPSSQAVLTLSTANYMLKPILTGIGIMEGWESSEHYEWATKCLAMTFCWAFAFVNIVNVKLAERTQISFTICKFSALLLIVGVGIHHVVVNGQGNIPLSYDAGNASISDYALAVYSCQWTYSGWSTINHITEELINPQRNLPLAIFIGVVSVIGCYLAVNLSYLAVLTKTEIQASTAVAVDATNGTLGHMSWIIPALVALSTAGTANASMFSTGRIGFAGSRDGHFPRILSYLHATHLSPIIAIFLNASLATFMICSSSVYTLINFTGFLGGVFYMMSFAANIVLRYTKPDVPRVIKVHIMVPVLAMLAWAFLVVTPIIQQPQVEHSYALVLFIVEVIWYTIFVHKKIKLPFSDTLTSKIQLLAYAAPSTYRED